VSTPNDNRRRSRVAVDGLDRTPHRTFLRATGLDDAALADPKLDVTRQYDLVHPAGFISHRATVVVDKKGKVAFVQVQEKTPEARDMAAVKAALAKLG